MRHYFKIAFTFFFFFTVVAALNACQKDSAEKAPVKTAPPKPVYNAQNAEKKAAERLAFRIFSDNPSPQVSDYIKLELKRENPDSPLPTGWLKALTPDDTQRVILVGHLENGPLKLPPLPLVIYKKQNADWTPEWQANGALSPLFVPHDDTPIDLSLELVFLSQSLPDLAKDATALYGPLQQNDFLLSSTHKDALVQASDNFFHRVGLAQINRFKNLAHGLFDPTTRETNALFVKDETGREEQAFSIEIQGHNGFVQTTQKAPALYHELLTTSIAGQSPRQALADLEMAFWQVPTETLNATCKAINGALQERMGLSPNDSAKILWHMVNAHSVFQSSVNYQEQCVNETLARIWTQLDLPIPNPAESASSNAQTNSYNRTLSQIARLLKNPDDANLQKLTTLFSAPTQIRDEARFLFTDSAFMTNQEHIAAATSPQESANFLMSLPVKSYGCYSNGHAFNGQSRATLLQIENDPNLWQLNFSFDGSNKINGLKLHKPSQYEFCQAIGGRNSNNPCRFAKGNYPGLHNDRCQP